MSRTITYIRHFEQSSHRIVDSEIKSPYLVDYQYDYIISSPYLRCRQTAEFINSNTQKPIYVDVRISEYQGDKNLKTMNFDPSTLVFGPIPDNTETWEQCSKRLDDHLNYILSLQGNVLIITHGIVVRYMEEKFFGRSQYSRGRHVPFGRGFEIRLI
jgi:broad specificity phosphatase PhoE